MKLIITAASLIFVLSGWTQEVKNGQDRTLPDTQYESVVSGFYNRVNVGVLGGSASSRSFNIVNGYRINQHWSAGFGLGIEEFYYSRYIPVFLEGNFNVLKRNTTPWISVMGGYELPYQNLGNNRGGITAGGKIGFSYFIVEHIGITTSIGYRYAHLEEEVNTWDWQNYTTVSDINRFEFRVGFVFK